MVLVATLTTVSVVETATTTKSFNVKKGGTLIVDIEDAAADITVNVWKKGEVLVKIDGFSEEALEDLEMTESGNTVRIEFYGDGGWRKTRSARFSLNVPEEFNLQLSTSGGDIRVMDRIKGDVDAATSGGDVEVEAVEGKLDLATSGGDIVARDVIGDAKLSTSGGDIDVGNVKGKLNVATSGGDITIGSVESSLKAATAGGDITIEDVGGDASVATAGGDIEVGTVLGSAALKTAGGDIELHGASGEVVAKTAGGDIECMKITGSLDAATAGGDIYAELDPKGNQPSDIETSGGNIKLVIPSGADVLIDARIRIRGHRDEDDYEVISDFEAESYDKDNKNIRAKYVIGKGGVRILLETVNGDIEIRKASRSKK